VLARLNTDELAARAVQARAGVAQARANLAKAQHDHRRAEELRPRGFVSSEQYEQARTSFDVARASYDSARALADQAEANLAKAAIRSPIDGMVLDRKVERGQTVASSFQTPELFVIASDLTQLELTVDIDEADIGGVRVGQAATFEVDAYTNRSFAARLAELRNAARTVANVVTYQGVLAVDNAQGLLKPGMTATADIEVRRAERAVTVANRALRFTPDAARKDGAGASATRPADTARLPPLAPGTGRLWTLGADGTPVARVVRVGISDGTRTEILGGGVRPGERFIVDVDSSPRAPERGRGVRIRL
jgi:HlyD family secretion protein